MGLFYLCTIYFAYGVSKKSISKVTFLLVLFTAATSAAVFGTVIDHQYFFVSSGDIYFYISISSKFFFGEAFEAPGILSAVYFQLNQWLFPLIFERLFLKKF